ncbi:MAG: YfhO family protein, partial [Bacteroidales bacterium]|nr:YfhO family protein [Bacteroidales bacterium]
NMLNAKYFILDPKSAPIRNPNAYGNAWMANQFTICKDALEEMTQLNKIKTKHQIVLDEKYADAISGKTFELDSTASILLSSYHPNHLAYKFASKKEQLVVFSEIYYAPNGWQAYIDGQEADHFRANYILRAMVVPAGEHKIEFKFEPKSYFIGTKISLASSYLLILVFIGGLLWELWRLWKSGKAKQLFSK